MNNSDSTKNRNYGLGIPEGLASYKESGCGMLKNNPTGMKMSTQDHPWIFSEQRRNLHTSGKAAAVPKQRNTHIQRNICPYRLQQAESENETRHTETKNS